MNTAKLTKNFIKENPAISYCLKKGLINYTKLAQYISKELDIIKKSSIEAIAISSIRYEKEIKRNTINEVKIRNLLKKATLDIKTNISYILIKKKFFSEIQYEKIKDFQFSYLTQTNNHYLVIFEDQNKQQILEIMDKVPIDLEHNSMVFLSLKTSKIIEETPGVISYLMGLITEQQINIYEFVSCFDTTYFLVHKKDFPKVYEIIEKITN